MISSVCVSLRIYRDSCQPLFFKSQQDPLMTEAQPYSNAYQFKEYFSDIFCLKTKLLTFHHHRTDADFSSVLMQGYDLKVDPYFERFGGFKFISNIKGNFYLRSIATDAGQKIGDLCGLRKEFNPPASFYFYKSQCKLEFKYP